jgi:hypothetical protein
MLAAAAGVQLSIASTAAVAVAVVQLGTAALQMAAAAAYAAGGLPSKLMPTAHRGQVQKQLLQWVQLTVLL